MRLTLLVLILSFLALAPANAQLTWDATASTNKVSVNVDARALQKNYCFVNGIVTIDIDGKSVKFALTHPAICSGENVTEDHSVAGAPKGFAPRLLDGAVALRALTGVTTEPRPVSCKPKKACG